MKTGYFGMGFFGRMPFGTDERKDFFDKWSEMTDEEKQAFMKERGCAIDDGRFDRGDFSGKRELSVEAIDQRCEEWLKKTPEEKEALIRGRREMTGDFRRRGEFFECGRRFGFGEENKKKETVVK